MLCNWGEHNVLGWGTNGKDPKYPTFYDCSYDSFDLLRLYNCPFHHSPRGDLQIDIKELA